MPADRRAPLDARAAPLARDLQRALGRSDAGVGIDRRPALSVVSATFNPRPSPPTMLARGTRTSVKRSTPL